MIYKDIFELRGTEKQIKLIAEALDSIKFPWKKIPHQKHFVIGWAKLNDADPLMKQAKMHQGDHPASDTDTDKIQGVVENRKYTMGVFYPSSGNIYIANALIDFRDMAKATVSAEIAHLVDFFLPLTDEMRRKIDILMHDSKETPHSHTWWEVADYGREYYTLIGESFMQAFTLAYTDLDFDHSGFEHYIRKDQAAKLREIIGIQRTDYTPEETRRTVYKKFRSLIYHKLSHYKNPGELINDTSGLKPCKICLR
jgi:hypothetical protein